MLAPWHMLTVAALFIALAAFVVAAGLLWLLAGVYKQVERENSGWDQLKREKRSAAAKQGHVTRKARVGERVPMSDKEIQTLERMRERMRRSLESEHDAEVERVLRQIDAQAEAKAK